MKRSASMLAGLCRVKNELPDDPKALEEMIQDLRVVEILDPATDTYPA